MGSSDAAWPGDTPVRPRVSVAQLLPAKNARPLQSLDMSRTTLAQSFLASSACGCRLGGADFVAGVRAGQRRAPDDALIDRMTDGRTPPRYGYPHPETKEF